MGKEILYNLIERMSPSGLEKDVQQYIAKTYKANNNEFEVTEKGVLVCTYNKDKDFSIMLQAHSDEISLIIDGYNSNGSFAVSKNGGIKPALYQGCKVKILTEDGRVFNACMGVNGNVKEKISVDDLFVDAGFSSDDEAKKVIPLGSYVIHDTVMSELQNNLLCGRAFDDRACTYIIHEAAKLAMKEGCENKLLVTTTTGEETTGRGAYQSSSKYKPNVVVVVDVTYAADYPQTDERGHIALGKGGAICNGSIPNRKLNALLREAANEIGLPVQEEVFSGYTGTDGDVANKTGDGPAIVLFSLPLRYMHSPAEVISYDDIESMIKVLARFLVKLSKDTNLLPYEI